MSSKQEWSPRCSLAEADKILCRPGSLLEVETRLVDGRVLRVWKNLWPSLRSLWLWAAKEHAHKTCIVFEGQRLTYSQAFSESLKCAAIFRDLYGVKKGDRIAICSRNYASYFTVFWACHLLGAVSVLVNALLPLDPLKHCLALGDCKVIILDPQRADLLENEADITSWTCRFVVIEAHEGKGHWRGMDDLTSLMARYNGNPDSVITDDPDVEPEDNATIIFTSGTTGLPKGVLSSQRAFLTNIFNVAASSGRDAIRRGDPFPPPPPAEGAPQRAALLSTPLFHVTATAVMLNATFLGFKIVSLRKWDGKAALRLIREENVVLLGAVPSVIRDLAEFHSPEEQTPIEVIIYGGAPVAEPLLDKARKAFITASIGQGYGLTESNAGSVGFAGKDFELRPTSAGTALPTNDVMIVNGDGVQVPPNVVGEVWLRGSNIMKGYWRDPDATAAILTKDGWLKTGDLGHVDDEGFVYIKDRIKDIIIRGGENIPSVTVENALYKEPGVSEAAAVGVPDERLGELVTALVTLKPGYDSSVTEESLLALARASLPRFAVPVMILVQKGEFEHTQSGKVIKKNLRAIAKEEWLKRRAQAPVKDTKL